MRGLIPWNVRGQPGPSAASRAAVAELLAPDDHQREPVIPLGAEDRLTADYDDLVLARRVTPEAA
jgi:hypothetical protein